MQLQLLLTLLPLHTHLQTSPSGLQLNLKYLKFFSTVPTSSLTVTRWPHTNVASQRMCLCLNSCYYQHCQPVTRLWQLSLYSLTIVSPLLQKSYLDKEELSNYCPISNLSLISKIIERVVMSRLTSHISANNLLNPHQSVYCKNHSTETAVLYIYDHLINAISTQQISCLCLLDLSAAFDAIDHNILLSRLSSWFGINGTVLNWFSSYLSSRSFCVKCNNKLSSSHTSCCGVPTRLCSWSSTIHPLHHPSEHTHFIFSCKSPSLCRWHSTLPLFSPI